MACKIDGDDFGAVKTNNNDGDDDGADVSVCVICFVCQFMSIVKTFPSISTFGFLCPCSVSLLLLSALLHCCLSVVSALKQKTSPKIIHTHTYT